MRKSVGKVQLNKKFLDFLLKNSVLKAMLQKYLKINNILH